MKRKVAIADDHLLVISGLKAMLEQYEHLSIIFAATKGEALLESLSADQPEVLLLDIQLPDISGIDLCKTLPGNTLI